MKLSSTQYNLLYSIYSFPNIILPFLGGLMVDRLGVRIGIFLFTLILIVGQVGNPLNSFYPGGTLQQLPYHVARQTDFRFRRGMPGSHSIPLYFPMVPRWQHRTGHGYQYLLFSVKALNSLGSTLNSLITPNCMNPPKATLCLWA